SDGSALGGVALLNPDGTPDTDVANDGQFTFALSAPQGANWPGPLSSFIANVCISPDGRIIVAGSIGNMYGSASGAASVGAVNVLPDETTPAAAASNVQVTAISDSQLQLTWHNNATNAVSITIERSDDGKNWSALQTVSANTITY